MTRAATPERTRRPGHWEWVPISWDDKISVRLTRSERCVILARRRGWTNATLADRCAPAAGRVVTHQMVSEVLRPRVRRSNMSAEVRAALIAEIERVVGDGR